MCVDGSYSRSLSAHDQVYTGLHKLNLAMSYPSVMPGGIKLAVITMQQ